MCRHLGFPKLCIRQPPKRVRCSGVAPDIGIARRAPVERLLAQVGPVRVDRQPANKPRRAAAVGA